MRFKDLAEKMIAVEERIARERGPMNLFALLEHEDSANYLDLIVAADWAFRSKVPSKRYLTEVLAEELDLDERMVIGRMYIFDPGREGMDEAARLAHVEHGLVEVRDEDIYGAHIRRGYFITSHWPANDGTNLNASKPSKPVKSRSATKPRGPRATPDGRS